MVRTQVKWIATLLMVTTLIGSRCARAQDLPSPQLELETMANAIRSVASYEQQATSLLTTTEISFIRSLPVQHPETGEIITFNAWCRDVLQRFGRGALEGSSLERDPVGTAVMLMLDTDYLLKARLIRTNTGQWISLAEAARQEIGSSPIELLARYDAMQRAYEQRQPNALASAILSFYKAVRGVNVRLNPRQRAEASADEIHARARTGRRVDGPVEGEGSLPDDSLRAVAEVVQIDGAFIEALTRSQRYFRAGTRVEIIDVDGEIVAEGVTTTAMQNRITVELQAAFSSFYHGQEFRVVPFQQR